MIRQRGGQTHADRSGRLDVTASRRPAVAGGLAALWALLVGLVLVTCLVMLTWAFSPNSGGDSASAWRATGVAWLAAHLVPPRISGVQITLLPVGATLMGLLLARRGGRWVGRLLPEPTRAEVAAAVFGSAALYGLGGAAVAWLSASSGGPSLTVLGRAAINTGLIAGIGLLWGLAVETHLLARAQTHVSEAAWRTAIAGLAVVVGLFATGAVIVAASLIKTAGDVAAALGSLNPGFLGATGVTIVNVLALPTLAIWGAAVAVGPGFAIGSAGNISAFGGSLGTIPALPILAALPTKSPGWAPLLLACPVLLGVMASKIRWGRDLPTLSGALFGAAGMAAWVLLLSLGMFRVASGSLGGHDLVRVGPTVAETAIAATCLAVLGFLLDAGAQSLRLSWDLYKADRRALASAPLSVTESGQIDLESPSVRQAG